VRAAREIGRALGLGTACAVIATALGACSAPGYGHDRLLDLTDIVDVGYGMSMGLGVVAQATLYLEAGLGIAETWNSREWFGRRSASLNGGSFVGMLVFTGTGHYSHGSAPMSSIGVLCVNVLAVLDDDHPDLIDRFRFGGRVYLPGVHAGLFVNVGEIVDLLCGMVGLDPAGDDGVAKSASLDERPIPPIDPPPPPHDDG
jgi:hypothetical protein